MRFSTLAATAVLAAAAAASAAAQTQPPARRGGDASVTLQQFLVERDRLFDRIDANHDGQITSDEVAAFGAQLETARAGAMIRSGRERPDGGRQLKRLTALTEKGPLTRARWEAMMTQRFQRLDTAGTGSISRAQLRGGEPAMAAQPGAPAGATPPSPPQP